MDGQPKGTDPLTRRADEGIEQYLARLRALDTLALTGEQRRMLAALIAAVCQAGGLDEGTQGASR